MSDIEAISGSPSVAAQTLSPAQAAAKGTREDTSAGKPSSGATAAGTPSGGEENSSVYNTVQSAANSTVRGTGVSVVV